MDAGCAGEVRVRCVRKNDTNDTNDIQFHPMTELTQHIATRAHVCACMCMYVRHFAFGEKGQITHAKKERKTRTNKHAKKQPRKSLLLTWRWTGRRRSISLFQHRWIVLLPEFERQHLSWTIRWNRVLHYAFQQSTIKISEVTSNP